MSPDDFTPTPELLAAKALSAATDAAPVLQGAMGLLPQRDRLLLRDCARACANGHLFSERARADLAVLLERLDEEVEAETDWRYVTVQAGAIGEEPLYDGLLRAVRTVRGMRLEACHQALARVAHAVFRMHALIEAEQCVEEVRNSIANRNRREGDKAAARALPQREHRRW